MQTGFQAVPRDSKGQAHRQTDVVCPSNPIQEERSWRGSVSIYLCKCNAMFTYSFYQMIILRMLYYIAIATILHAHTENVLSAKVC